jgi:hypothetical protein
LVWKSGWRGELETGVTGSARQKEVLSKMEELLSKTRGDETKLGDREIRRQRKEKEERNKRKTRKVE